ncbi:MAG: cytochrome c [Desulfobulbaceae bacterium]
MKNHVLRPLWVAIAFIALILLARYILVPSDFGVQGESFTFNFHRAGNVAEWRDSKEGYPGVAYLGRDVCADCHDEKIEQSNNGPHGIIECENCHGPGRNHPETEDPSVMTIDRSRALCLRCHADLGYQDSNRANIPGIDPEEHNAEKECVSCHNPHTGDFKEGVE